MVNKDIEKNYIPQYHLVWDSHDHIHSTQVIFQQLLVVCKAKGYLECPLDLPQFFHSHEPQQD